MTHSEKIARYIELRALGRELNNQLVQSVGRRFLIEGGRRLGIARGNILNLNTEDEISVLADYCIHDLRHDGQNAINRFLMSQDQNLNPEQINYLNSLAQAFYSLFIITHTDPGVGISAQDMVSGQNHFIFDIGFSESTHLGFVFAARIFTHEGITMTTGTGLPVSSDQASSFVQKILALKTDDSKLSFKVTAEITRELLASGASTKVMYEDISKNSLPFFS